MTKIFESPEHKVSEAESIIQEYRAKLEKALKIENDKLKERAEQDSTQILAKASEESKAIIESSRREAEQILKEARDRADEESSKKFARAQQESERIIREADRLADEKAKEKTKNEVQRILAKTREETDKAIAQAKKDAKVESDKIIGKSKEEAEQIAREARERASNEARQESARILSDTQEKASQIVAEILSHGTEQVKSQFTRIVSEAKDKLESEIAPLVTEMTKSIEQVMGETEKSVQAELKYLATVIAEVERQLKPDIDKPEKESAVSLNKITKEDVAPFASPARAEVDVRGKSTPVEVMDNPGLYKGNLNIEVSPPYDREQLNAMLEHLAQVPGLKVLSAGGYLDKDKCVMTYCVDVAQPAPLLKILRAMPQVDEVSQRGEKVGITMKTGGDSVLSSTGSAATLLKSF
jgi:F0F1-type ATP synthase membrane subunit b/b'